MTTKSKTKTTTVDPSRLAPDFDNIPGELIAEEYSFWFVIRPNKIRNSDETGENIGDPVQRAKGQLIKIPDEKMIAGAADSGRRLKPYVKQPGDRPATEFMYFLHAPDKVRGNKYQTISEVGLEWPGAIEEAPEAPKIEEVKKIREPLINE